MMKRILIVDNEADIRKVLSVGLKNRHFEVETVNDGKEALKRINENPPDLVILDIMMPGMDGTQVATSLKQNKSTAKIPIIFLSALQTKEDEQDSGNQIGGNTIFGKPYDLDVLVAKIKELTA